MRIRSDIFAALLASGLGLMSGEATAADGAAPKTPPLT